MATTTEPSSIRGTIRLPAGRIGVRACAIGMATAALTASFMGMVLSVGQAEWVFAGFLAAVCVVTGIVFALGLVIAGGRLDPFTGAMVTLVSTICAMVAALVIGLAFQVALDPAAGPFWLALGAGSIAAMWAEIMTALPALSAAQEEL